MRRMSQLTIALAAVTIGATSGACRTHTLSSSKVGIVAPTDSSDRTRQEIEIVVAVYVREQFGDRLDFVIDPEIQPEAAPTLRRAVAASMRSNSATASIATKMRAHIATLRDVKRCTKNSKLLCHISGADIWMQMGSPVIDHDSATISVTTLENSHRFGKPSLALSKMTLTLKLLDGKWKVVSDAGYST